MAKTSHPPNLAKPTQPVGKSASVSSQIAQAALQATTREQERIGYELHDGLGQHLTGLAFYAKALALNLSQPSANSDPKADAQAAQRLVEIANQAVGMTRALARGLQPIGSEQGALALALRQFCADAGQLYGVACEGSIDDVDLTDRDAAQHLYRITQEALNNAVRHGQATRVRIDLLHSGNTVQLTVSNNGTPLADAITAPEQVNQSTAAHTKGMGLASMKLRAKQINARLQLRNLPQISAKHTKAASAGAKETDFTVELRVTYKILRK